MAKRSSSGSTNNIRNFLVAVIVILLGAVFEFVQQRGTTPATPAVQVTATRTAGTKATAVPVTAVADNGGSTVNGPTNTGLNWLSVYFTDPANTNEADLNPDKYVTKYVLPVINATKQTLDITSFDLNLPAFVDAVVAAKKRGVGVRVIVDEENGVQTLKASDAPSGVAEDALKTLADAKIPVVDGGRSNGLMHNKMIIADGKTLIMGSWNMSYNDTLRNNNNVLIITNPQIIANYQAKFNEGFLNRQFGAKAQVKAITPSLNIGGVQVENYFSPDDKVMDKLAALVATAKKSVKFIIFTYTDQRLSDSMIERFKAGVKVSGVIENRGASQGAMPALFCAKVPVKVDGNKYTMHHKVIIIDDQIVVTGSFNFTKSADTANDDNVLIIHSPAVAKMYSTEYDRVYGLGKTPTEVTCP